jgi:DNA-binding CsgD family transcriptional regulator/tetratricopeptide (TPR) repeat protein
MSTSHSFLEPLTSREADVLRGMVEGLTNAEIADRLVLSADTVKWYVKQLYGKLGAHSRQEAIAQAVASSLTADKIASTAPNNDRESNLLIINPLPQDVSDRYIGQAEKLSQVVRLLQQRARLISIYGRAGSGKTALACQGLNLAMAGRKSLERWSGAVCLTSTGTGITLNRLFADIGRLLPDKDQAQLEAVSRNSEIPLAQKIGILLERISNRHIVLLLDNLETIQNAHTGELSEPGLQQFVEMCVTQSSALTLLITSREPLYLPRQLKTWEQLISLEDGLSLDDSIALLRRFDPSGAAGLRDATTDELSEVAGKLGGFPRALEAVAGILLEDPLLRLADVKQKINQLEGEISAAVVQQALAHLDGEAMGVLEALAIFDQPIHYETLAHLLSPFLDESSLRSLLGRLIRACFVKTNRSNQQFALHPIDQAYCYSQIPAGSPNEDEAGAILFTRIVLHSRAARYFQGLRLPRTAWRKITDLEPQLNEFKHWIKAGVGDEAARVLLEIDRDYLWEWEYKDLLRQLYPTLSGLVKEPHLVMHVARRQAWLKFFSGTDEAEQEFTRLLAESRQMGFVKEEADALDDLGQIFRRGNRDARKAIEYHQQALARYRAIVDRRGEADALGGIGATFAYFEPEEAIEYLLAAADIHRELGNSSSLSFIMSMLGIAYLNLGSLDQAKISYEEAVEIARQNSCLEALSRAYGLLAGLYVLSGEEERVVPLLEEAMAANREFAGVPMSGQLLFFGGQAAFYLALANDIPAGIALMERILHEAEAVQPSWVQVGHFFLSLILTLGGDYQKALGLLPPVGLLSRGVGNSYWIGVLLIKTGETNNAEPFLNKILSMSQPNDPYSPGADYRDKSMLPMRALALAGLALLKRDSEMAVGAAELTRQMERTPNWQMALHRALIALLIQEPGGEILIPVQDVLDSTTQKKPDR